jgi:hypothetical protein
VDTGHDSEGDGSGVQVWGEDGLSLDVLVWKNVELEVDTQSVASLILTKTKLARIETMENPHIPRRY